MLYIVKGITKKGIKDGTIDILCHALIIVGLHSLIHLNNLWFYAMCLLYLACLDWFTWTIFCYLVSLSIFVVLEFVLYIVKGINTFAFTSGRIAHKWKDKGKFRGFSMILQNTLIPVSYMFKHTMKKVKNPLFSWFRSN